MIVLGVVCAVATAQLIGMILYSKLVLGKPWLKASFPGKTFEQKTQLQKVSFYFEFIVCLCSQVVLVLAIHYVTGPFLGVKTIESAVKVGLSMTVLAALIDIPHCAFGHRSVIGFFINHLYNALVFICSCISLVYFR